MLCCSMPMLNVLAHFELLTLMTVKLLFPMIGLKMNLLLLQLLLMCVWLLLLLL